MATLLDDSSPYYPEFYPSGPDPDCADVQDLFRWLAEHDDTYPDECPELDLAETFDLAELDPSYEPGIEDLAWWAVASNARPSLCRAIPPSARGPEDLDGPTPTW